MEITPFPVSLEDLRTKAEKLAINISTEDIERMSSWDVRKLIQELQIHHVELEMQNEEIIRAATELEGSRQKYIDLYDRSPVGYTMLEKNTGRISELNLTMTQLLGTRRNLLQGQRFEDLVASKDRTEFYEFFKNIFTYHHKHMCEISIIPKNGAPVFVRLEGMESECITGNTRCCNIAVIDISDRKSTETEIVNNAVKTNEEHEYSITLLRKEIAKRREVESQLREEIEFLKQQ